MAKDIFFNSQRLRSRLFTARGGSFEGLVRQQVGYHDWIDLWKGLADPLYRVLSRVVHLG
jgi:hypothetical protein